MQVLKLGASFYISFNSNFLTINNSADGLGNYLGAIQGAEVSWLNFRDNGENVVLKIKKTKENFKVPTLRLEDFHPGESNNPIRGPIPHRRYSW